MRRIRAVGALAFAVAISAIASHASIASAGVLTWNCVVQPGSWCEYPQAEPYFYTIAQYAGTLPLAMGNKLILQSNGTDYASSFGNACDTCSGFAGLYLTVLPDHYYYPLIYNGATVAHNMHATSLW